MDGAPTELSRESKALFLFGSGFFFFLMG
jgi:hypothetical protein